MSRRLAPGGGRSQLIGPTTTTKLAQRMICGLQETAACLPPELNSPIVLDILLTLYIEEESACYPSAAELNPTASISPAITARWIAVLVARGLVERRDDLLALTGSGNDMIVTLIDRIYAAQRRLD